MPFVEGGIVEDVVEQPTPSAGGFVQGGAIEDPTPEDSYQRVLQYQAGMLPDIPTKEEFLSYEAVSRKKPLLGERPLQTIGTAAVETGKMLATLPYRAGEAISETAIMPPEGVTRGQALGATGAEVAMQSRLGAEKLVGGVGETIMSKLDDLSQFLGGKARSEDDRYKAFLSLSDIKRTLALAQSGQVPAAQEVLQAYNIPKEAISPAGVEVGGFAAAPENIAFAGGGKIAGQLLSEAARALPTVAGAAQRTGAAIGQVARYPETAAGRAVAGMTGSEAAGAAVESAIGKGTTGIALGEAAGIPIAGTLNIPGIGGAARAIGTAKAVGAGLETAGEAGLAAQGAGLSPIERGLLGYGERIAAQEGGSRAARALGTAIARTGLETPVKTAAGILVPAVGAGVAGGALAGLAGEEGDQVASAIGSGLAFGGIEAGLRMQVAAAKEAFNGTRVRETALNDLNTRPNDVQFTYVNPTTKAEQVVTIADRNARGEFYGKLDNKQLPKALSEIANAENAGIEVIFHKDGDPVPTDIQQIKYAGVSINPSSVRSGKPTILINVDRAKPETIPHEILHARITEDMVRRVGSQIVEGQINEAQFKEFANKYADAIFDSGDTLGSDRIKNELVTAFNPKLQRAQRIEALGRMADEFTAYYTQEFLAGKDPKTVLPGRIPSFFEAAFNKAKEAVAERFSTRALQSGFDPIARTFYDANGKRVKVPWMEDAIKQLIVERKGYEPREEKFDTRKLTPNQQAALIAARGYQDLFVLNPDGSIGRPLTLSELKLKDVDIANRTIQLLDSLPQADRGTVTGMDAKGNPVINGRLSLAEADALARSGIFSASTSRYLSGIADAIQNGKLLNGTYWKVYGKTGKAGVFGEAEKLFLPYAISVNRAGGVNIKAVDWGKVQSRMQTALQKQAYRNLFRSYDQAMNTLRDVYLKNIAEQNAVPSAEALGGGLDGAKKRNFFNEVMGAVPKKGDILINEPTAGYVAERKGGSVYQDLRIERLQNVEDTGFTLPWTGDMGEQSSYRRTQLNFQPGERIGETSTETDAKAGYRILSKQEKFRAYRPDGSLLGIFDSAEQAKLKAEKDYAAQTRLQPEVDQQQRVPGNEGRQTAEAGGGNRALGGTQGGQEGRQVDRTVRQAGDVGARFMPDQEGFYSKLEEVIATKIPKSASPQQILATVDPARGSGVKPEELKWTGFAQAVERIAKENGGKVPKEKLIEHLKNEGQVKFQEVTTGIEGKYISQEDVDRLERRAQRTRSNADWTAYENAVLQFESQELGTEAQYSKYQLPGGENYREVVLTSDTARPYTSSHFKNIDNYVAHSRLNERVDNDGKPGLFIEEIQSDRHQAARKEGYKEDQGIDWSKVPVYQYKDLVAKGEFPGVLHVEIKDGLYRLVAPDGGVYHVEGSLEKLKTNYNAMTSKGVFDAPFRKDWSLQMFKRALRDAVASGKEWIGWTTGDTQADRFNLRNQFDRIEVDRGQNDYFSVTGYDKSGNEVISNKAATSETLPAIVGEEFAAKIIEKPPGTHVFEGVDLEVGGEGMRGFYDKILPAEIQKYVKQWGGKVSQDAIETGGGKPTQYADFESYQKASKGQQTPIWRVDITPQMRKSVAETGQPRFMPSPDASMPGAYSFQGGFRALPGKEKGKLRIYGPAGNLIGIAASLEQAQQMIQKKAKQ